MAGEGVAARADMKNYNGEVTWFLLITCLVATTGGLIFGYDIGISGGVTSMDVFLEKFFPSVYQAQKKSTINKNHYCTFESQLLTAFISSLYIAGLVTTFFASMTTRSFGRKVSMLLGGATYLFGSALSGAAVNVKMLIVGRILLGFGVGFTNQAVLLYLSEMAPPELRGALNIGFQMATTIGILVANLVNYGMDKIEGQYGWRISMALAAVPASVLIIGALVLPETPNSLIERGHQEKAKAVLQKIRGTADVEEELCDLAEASAVSARVQRPWRSILWRHYRPQLAMAVMIPTFQQLTGINAIMFYAPVLFETLGFGSDASVMSAIITGIINVVATISSIVCVDMFGRRFLFLEGGLQMLVSQVAIGSILAKAFGVSGTGDVPKDSANGLMLLIWLYVAGFAWSWGPLGWLLPSEVFPLEIRSAGQSIAVSVNLFWTFIIAQLFTKALCHLKFGLFFLFAASVAVMTLFVFFFLPETKGVPIEKMNQVWCKHWFWKKFVFSEHCRSRERMVEMRRISGATASDSHGLRPQDLENCLEKKVNGCHN